MSFAPSRRRAWCARVAIVLAACPATARGQEAPATAASVVPVPRQLDPDSPLAPMPGLGVDWPDLARPDAPPPATPDAPAAVTKDARDKRDDKADAKAADTGDQRYTIRLEGVDALAGSTLRSRFDDLSALGAGESKPANTAQIDRRARQDADLLRDLFRAGGYYDAEVDIRVTQAAGPGLDPAQHRLTVTLAATSGPRYVFDAVTLTGLAAAGQDGTTLTRTFGVHVGDAIETDRVIGAVTNLRRALGVRGYPFATVADPDIEIDHDRQRARFALRVDPGRQMRIGALRLSGRKVFGPNHLALISRLKPGDRYNAARLDDLRRALVQTGLVSVVQVTPVRTADPQVVDLDVHLEPAPPRTVSASFGYTSGARLTPGTLGYSALLTTGALGFGTGEGATAEVDWTHRNLFPPEGSLTLRGVLGTQEQLASAIFRRNDFRARDQVLTAQLTVDHIDVAAYAARTVDVTAGVERQTNIIWQKKWTYSYGVELFGSDERDEIEETGQPRRRTYVVAAVPLSLSYDGSDDLLNPTRGWRLSARVSPEESLHNATFTYARIQLDGSAYQPIGRHVVLAGRVRLGSIQGGTRDEIAPTRRFYAGGGGSVRGFGYQRIGPRDVDNDPIGGTSLAELGLEARVRFGDFGVVPFLDGGNLYVRSLPKFTRFRYGTGLGIRYYTSFGPIRLDVGTPINPQSGDSRVAVYVSLGQAF